MIQGIAVSRWVLAFAWAWAALQPAAAQPAVLDGIRAVDQQGRSLEARRLAGHPVLLHFVFAGCTSSCPTQLLELAELHRSLPEAVRAKIRFVSVTVDPLSDTPQALAALARRMGADREGWTFLTGRPDALAPLYERMAVFDSRRPRASAEDHRTSLYLYAADGRLLQRFRGVPVDRARLRAEIDRL